MLQTPLCSGQSADFTPRKLYSTRDASWRVKLALHHWLKISSGIFVLIFYSCIFFPFLFFFYFPFLPVLVHQGKFKRLPLFSSTDCPIEFFIKIGLFDTRRQARTRGGAGNKKLHIFHAPAQQPNRFYLCSGIFKGTNIRKEMGEFVPEKENLLRS